MLLIPNASSPENAPAMEPAEKKTASLPCSSPRRYQHVNKYVAAGKNPAWGRIIISRMKLDAKGDAGNIPP